MKGMDLNDFINKIYYGDEIEFKFNGTTYFIQGYRENDKFFLCVDYWAKTDGTEPEHDYAFSVYCNSLGECVDQFEKAKIFGGKTIYEAEQDIEVVYG